MHGLFLDALRAAPDRAFLAMEQGTLTYSQAADWSKAVASGLAARGIKRGDRVAIVSTNRPEMVVLWPARLGSARVLLPPQPRVHRRSAGKPLPSGDAGPHHRGSGDGARDRGGHDAERDPDAGGRARTGPLRLEHLAGPRARRRGSRLGRGAGGRPGGHPLHVGDDRPLQGRGLVAPLVHEDQRDDGALLADSAPTTSSTRPSRSTTSTRSPSR